MYNLHACVYLPQLVRMYAFIMHVAVQFGLSTVTVSAEGVDGQKPAARVTWSTTIPSECVTSVTVEFRTDRLGEVVANYTTTNTSQNAIIQTGLQCDINYITVAVTAATSDGVHAVISRVVQVFVGGKEIVHVHESQ